MDLAVDVCSTPSRTYLSFFKFCRDVSQQLNDQFVIFFIESFPESLDQLLKHSSGFPLGKV